MPVGTLDRTTDGNRFDSVWIGNVNCSGIMRRNFCAAGVFIVGMNSSAHLNPASWRDDDQQRRIAIGRELSSGVGAALRTNFPVVPLCPEFQKMLDELR